MKITRLLFAALFFAFAGLINAQALLTENFDYAAGDSLRAHDWNITGTSTFNTISVVSPGLTYTGYTLSGIGNAAGLNTTGQDVNKALGDSVSSGAVYASVMVNVTSAQAPGDYFMHFGIATDNSQIFIGRVFVKLAANGNLAFGLSKSSVNASVPAVYSDSIYTTGTTYLLVLKYSFSTASTTDDTASLFINPAITTTEPAPVLTHNILTTGEDPVSLKTFNLRQGTASNAAVLTIDGIHVGRIWADVLPVELTSFTATTSGNAVVLNWKTATEINNSGFNVERKTGNSSWENVAFIKGNGTTTQSQTYSYADRNLTSGKYSYRLKQVDFNGTFAYSAIVEANVVSPEKYELAQNYPNPFNPSTKISFNLPDAGNVKLSVYNVLGQEVKTLINGFTSAGSHTIEFNAAGLNSGLYFYKIEAGNFSEVKKMTLLK